jgi:hypothetical protein
MSDDITDDMIASAARSLGLTGSGSPGRASCQYEAIQGHGRWHVMRVRGERRECVRIVPTQADANNMIKMLKKADRRGEA